MYICWASHVPACEGNLTHQVRRMERNFAAPWGCHARWRAARPLRDGSVARMGIGRAGLPSIGRTFGHHWRSSPRRSKSRSKYCAQLRSRATSKSPGAPAEPRARAIGSPPPVARLLLLATRRPPVAPQGRSSGQVLWAGPQARSPGSGPQARSAWPGPRAASAPAHPGSGLPRALRLAPGGGPRRPSNLHRGQCQWSRTARGCRARAQPMGQSPPFPAPGSSSHGAWHGACDFMFRSGVCLGGLSCGLSRVLVCVTIPDRPPHHLPAYGSQHMAPSIWPATEPRQQGDLVSVPGAAAAVALGRIAPPDDWRGGAPGAIRPRAGKCA